MHKNSWRPTTGTILFISTDAAQAHRRCADLAAGGLDATTASDPIDALAAVRSGHVDLVMVHLPIHETLDMDLIHVIRAVCPRPYLPVMIQADSAAEQEQCRYFNSGADDVICAETSPAETVARVGALLRIQELHDQLAASRGALEQALRRERRLLAKVRRDNDHLRDLATTDPLTGLQNVRSCHSILEHMFKTAKRYGHSLSVLVLDIDHFKLVNDAHGHPSGDCVLKDAATILRESVRESDIVARTGGEEFTVILSKAGRRQARRLAERVRRAIRSREFTAYGRMIRITASIGSATYPDDVEIATPGMLVYFADQALLAAKEGGRDRVVSFCDLEAAGKVRLRRQYLSVPAETEEMECEQIASASESGRQVRSA